jgi:glycosyltransferase involved in cell wall biosynthesis
VLDHITPLVLTLNESPNISRVLAKLSWARRVVVLDSFSTDDTETLARSFANVRLLKRPFDSHAAQWNFGLNETGIETAWVLALDADHILTDEMIDELSHLGPDTATAGFEAAFTYCVNGRPLRGAIYPPITVLYRRGQTSYVQDGHTQRAMVRGPVGRLKSRILHDDRKPLDRWIASQSRYMKLEADKLAGSPMAELTLPDKVRRLVLIAPFATFLYCLFAKAAILDGWPGLFYAAQRAVAEGILSLYLLQHLVFRRGA